MMETRLMTELSRALEDYRSATAHTTDAEAQEDYLRLTGITEKILAAMQSGDDAQAKLAVLGFSRQVSDSFAQQPAEFKLLAQAVAEVKRELMY